MAKYGNVLVVDDNESIFTTLEICLEGVFERILTLTKPDKILATLEQEHIDVILLDMNFSLGVNNGQEGLLWVQAIHRRHPNVPIVLMTAYADVKLAVKGLKSGAVDFVTKPWDNHELIRVLKDAIDVNAEVVSLEKWKRSMCVRWLISVMAILAKLLNYLKSHVKDFIKSWADDDSCFYSCCGTCGRFDCFFPSSK